MDISRKIIPLYNKEYFKIMIEEYSHMSYQYVFNVVFSVLDKYTRKKDNVLDIGCGVGWLLQRTLDLGCNAYGIDFATSGIKIVKAKLKEANLMTSDANHTPFREETFDLITCTWLLEHVEKPEEILAEVFRILKNSGLAIFMSPSGELIHTEKKSPVFTSLEEFGEEHFWEFSPIGLQYLLQKSGFTIKERRGIYRFHFLNLFTFPVFKLISSVAAVFNSKVKSSTSAEGTDEHGQERLFRIFERLIPSSIIAALLRFSFNFFMKAEIFLGNKPLFNFFGIETLFVCQKS